MHAAEQIDLPEGCELVSPEYDPYLEKSLNQYIGFEIALCKTGE